MTVSCRQTDGNVEFTHNPTDAAFGAVAGLPTLFLPPRATVRGLGTYSMRLLTEQFLHGSVGFASAAEGTTFFARYPLVFPG